MGNAISSGCGGIENEKRKVSGAPTGNGKQSRHGVLEKIGNAETLQRSRIVGQIGSGFKGLAREFVRNV